MLRWRYLTPGLVGGGKFPAKPPSLCAVTELAAAGSSFYPHAVMISPASAHSAYRQLR